MSVLVPTLTALVILVSIILGILYLAKKTSPPVDLDLPIENPEVAIPTLPTGSLDEPKVVYQPKTDVIAPSPSPKKSNNRRKKPNNNNKPKV